MAVAGDCIGCRHPVALIVVLALGEDACMRALPHIVQQPASSTVTQLWREPSDLESRDLFYGAGGADLRPQEAAHIFVAHKKSGTNPGYDVRDANGRLWSVKLGEEAQGEVTASRILWAVGFHQPPTYYVERWQLTGEEAGEQPGSRFRAELPNHEVIGEWSWYDNPFIGTRPFAALITVNMLLNNWDLKTSNNKVYIVADEDGVVERRYVVRDLGAAFGKAKQPRVLSWLPFMRHMQGSKNDLEEFESQGFVEEIDAETVTFDYRGLDDALARSVTPDDLLWMCGLLSRLSERQWNDAFRAGGYGPEQRARFVRKIQDEIARAQALVSRVAPRE